VKFWWIVEKSFPVNAEILVYIRCQEIAFCPVGRFFLSYQIPPLLCMCNIMVCLMFVLCLVLWCLKFLEFSWQFAVTWWVSFSRLCVRGQFTPTGCEHTSTRHSRLRNLDLHSILQYKYPTGKFVSYISLHSVYSFLCINTPNNCCWLVSRHLQLKPSDVHSDSYIN